MREVCQWQLLVSPGYQEQFSYLCIILDNSNEDLNAVSSMLLTGCVRSGCEGDRLTHALLGLTRHTHSSLGKSDWMNTLNIQIPCVRTKKAVGMLQRAEFAFRMEIIFPPRVRCTQYAKKIKIFIFANDPMPQCTFSCSETHCMRSCSTLMTDPPPKWEIRMPEITPNLFWSFH